MSLIKSFNLSYFKENIKKSRGIILILIILVPLFTALYTIVNINGTEEYISIPEKEWLANINMYGMYIIPVVLSFLLFGYVYKKNSVDLINSMPINRKSIFVTNTIVGIIIITLIQVLTAVALLLCNHYLEYLYIYTGVIIDLFVVMWVAYVFVYAATNLAMTMSGTFPTQLLLTAIILLLVPFIVDGYDDFAAKKEYKFILGTRDVICYVDKENTYTLPYKNLKHSTEYEVDYELYNIYDTTSIIKMLSLSATYFILGAYLFKKRKMESCEESFAKVRTHIFVKALTILPMIMLLNRYTEYGEYGEENKSIIFNLCLIIFYYYIYDFIVKRKVGVKTSIAGLILTLVFLQGTCFGINYLKENREVPTIRVEDIAEIAVNSSDYYDPYQVFDILNITSDANHFIKNHQVIQTVLQGAADIEEQQEKYDEELELYSNNEIEYISSYVDVSRTIDVAFKLNNGKEYRISYLNISENEYNNMINILENDETYLNLIKAELEKDDKILLDSKLCSEEFENKIKNEIRSKVDSIKEEDMFLDGNFGYLIKYYYEDHKLISKDICIELTPEMFNLCANEINKNSLAKLKNVVENNKSKSFFVDLSDEPMWYGLSNKYITLQKTKEDVSNLLMQEGTFNAKESFYEIEGDTEEGDRLIFFTNKVDDIDRLIQTEVEKNPEYYWQYEYELQKYYKSDMLYENHYFEEDYGEEEYIIYEDDFSEEIYVEDDTYEGNYIDVENYVVDNTVYIDEGNYVTDNTIYVEEGNYIEEIYVDDVDNTVTNEVVYENVV